MRVVRGFRGLGLELRDSAVTVGNFDGVHRGHQQVVRAAVAAASRRGVPAVVCTFEPHTLRVLAPERAPALLQTLAQRLDALSDLEVDVAVVIPFDADVAATPRSVFVEDFLCGELSVGSLHMSKGFQFGHDREGRTSYLEERGRELGFDVTRVAACIVGGRPVSSTRIRELLAAGDVQGAADLLGRPYRVAGRIVAGAGRGRGLGRPTANLEPINEIVPGAGVYSAVARWDDRSAAAVVNVGRRPTFESDAAETVEAHLLDVTADLYGSELALDFISRIREERRFDDAEALRRQIDRDVASARHALHEQI